MALTPPSRRTVLAAAPAGALIASGAEASTPSLADDIAAFVAFGEHRAGSPTEARTAGWIAARLARLGYDARTTSVPIKTILDPGGALTAEGWSTPAFPQWRTPPTDLNRPIIAPLSTGGSSVAGTILLAAAPAARNAYWPAATQSAALAARSAGAHALVIAFDDPTDRPYACNQESADDLPLPVAVVSPSALGHALAFASAGATGTLTLNGRPTPAEATVVIAARPGRGQAVVISTPLTGWFRCGAERGPGVALLLRLAGELRASSRPVSLVATGAHELGHLGMKHALTRGLPEPDRTALWIHLGAGIGAQALDTRFGVVSPRYLTAPENLATSLAEAFPSPAWTRLRPSPGAPGEAGDVIGAGYGRVLGLAGGFPGFHTPGDDASAVDHEALADIAASLSALLRSLA